MTKKLSPPLAAALALAALCAVLALAAAVRYGAYRRVNQPILEQNAALAQELRSAEDEAARLRSLLDETEAAVREDASAAAALRTAVEPYRDLLTVDSGDRRTYLEDKMAELLERRQDLLNGVRSQMESNLSGFFSSFTNEEYIPPEQVPVMKELFKSAISSVAGELDSAVADVAGETISAGLDGQALDAAVLDAIGQKVTDTVKDKVLDATGLSGLVSAGSAVSSAVSTMQGVRDNVPDYAVALTLDKALVRAKEVAALLADPAADTDTLRKAVDSYNYFIGYYRAAQNLRDDYSLTGMGELELYGSLAEADALDRALGVYAVLLREEAATP